MLGQAVFVGAITALIACLNYVELPLPYPAKQFVFKSYDPSLLPTNPMPLEGVFAPNEILRKGHRLFDGVVQSSEHVSFSPGGNMTLMDKYGYVFEAEPAAGVPGAVFPDEWALDVPALAYVGPGRPLGHQSDADGNLIIADALRGLLKLERPSNRLEVLSNRVSPDSPLAAGEPLTFVNALDIGKDGTIYFSASQDVPVGLSHTKPGFYDFVRSYFLGMFAGSMTGRLLKYDPATRRTEQLTSGFWFANGVALAQDESFVAVAESSRTRVNRYWLKGPKAGTTEVIIDRLPGFPDGLCTASDGNIWVALVVPITVLPKLLQYKPLRVLLAYLPASLSPPLPRWGAALKISPDGKPLQLLMDPDGSKLADISSITEHDGKLYFGNVKDDYVSYFDLKDAPPLEQARSS